ncbi:uncharacterized protein LOC133105501 [Conger conger]|uniref:uncharacterized protein LOC133105501 n=1 Tax=Conger conger TaxID=82655 RepID=UPI002A5A8FA8|nr:uncharacterized protein LOC133105501 [Conger conger]XP_061071625.1 uncharacterized protein LOC133105501 [Conger conger]XP_061071626.1 uncharacterized protein LOC133105501 [Conger conger]
MLEKIWKVVPGKDIFVKKKELRGFELWEREARERQARQQRNNDKKGETQPPSYFSAGASGKSTPCLYPSLTMLKHSEVDTDLDCPVPRPPPQAPPSHQPAPVLNTPTIPPAPAPTLLSPPHLQTPGRGTPQPPTLTPSTGHTRSGLQYQPRKNYPCAIPNCQFPATGSAADRAPSHTAEAWERQYGLKDIPEGEWNKELYQGDPEGWYGPKPDDPPHPQLTMGQFPMVECPDPHQPGQVQLVYRPYTRDELRAICSELPNPSQTGGETFYDKLMEIIQCAKPSSNDLEGIMRKHLGTRWGKVRDRAGVPGDGGQVTAFRPYRCL